jgi:uncharacterized protein YaiL (DUF2058 family)
LSDSLQDQLRALGLAKKTAGRKKQAVAGKRAKPRGGKRSAKAGPPGEMSLEKAYALKKRDEQKKADLVRRKKQEEDRKRRLLNNQIRDIVKANRLNHPDAEIARNFMFRGRIRKINVNPDQLKALNAGELGIVYLSGGYHLLTLEFADQVRAISAEHVVDLDTCDSGDDEEFPVPDDLSW